MRSKLFVPASRPALFEKAIASGADAVCFDLEDAVPLLQKSAARDYLTDFLSNRLAGSPLLMVRINLVMPGDYASDLSASVWPSVFAIAIPKVESPNEVEMVDSMLSELEPERGIPVPLGIVPTIESPRGLRQARQIAASSSRIVGLQIGFADLLEPLGITTRNSFARDQVRLMIRFAAAEVGIDCYESAFSDYRDLTAFERYLEGARDFGFAGCSCIHPSQVELANAIFSPSAQELIQAQRIVDAAREAELRGDAVTTLEGKMIDRPYVLGAERILSRCGHSASAVGKSNRSNRDD